MKTVKKITQIKNNLINTIILTITSFIFISCIALLIDVIKNGANL